VPADAPEIAEPDAVVVRKTRLGQAETTDCVTRLARTLHDGLPCVVGVPVLVGIAVTLWRLSSIRYPHLGWAQTIANDAKSVSFGDWIYGDPSHQYTGMLYTPLYPVLLAPLYRVLWWDGWPIAVTTIAGITTAVVVGLVAGYDRDLPRRWADRALAGVGAIGVGGTAWWIVSTDYRNLLYDGRADQLAWCLAILGLCSVAIAIGRAPVRVWPSVLLLSAALWTKQTTIGALLAATVMLTWWFVRGAVNRRVWLRFVLAVAATNLLVLILLEVVSHGWAVYFLLTMPGRHFRDSSVFVYVKEFRNLLVAPSLLLAIAASGIALGHRRIRPRSLMTWARDVSSDIRGVFRRTTDERRNVPPFAFALVALVVLFLIFSVPPAFTGRRKQGGEVNQYIGMLWGLGLLLALAHRSARKSPRATVAGIVTYGLLVSAIHIGGVRSFVEARTVALPTTYPTATFVSLSPSLRDYARTHLVYLPYDADLSSQFTHRTWPMQQNIVDLLAAGEPPMYLVDAFIDREFDAVWPFDPAADPYASAYGQTEENFLWKVNQIIDQGYVADPSVGLLVRREGDLDLSWMRTCFGAFDLGGTQWEIRHGGGLWCQSDADSIELRGTPAPVTEIVSTDEVVLHGRVIGELPHHTGAFEIVATTGRGNWSIRVAARAGGGFDVVKTDANGRQTASVVEPDGDGRFTVGLGTDQGSGGTTVAPTDAKARLTVRATIDSAVRLTFDLDDAG
jgi:hypothetical protein